MFLLLLALCQTPGPGNRRNAAAARLFLTSLGTVTPLSSTLNDKTVNIRLKNMDVLLQKHFSVNIPCIPGVIIRPQQKMAPFCFNRRFIWRSRSWLKRLRGFWAWFSIKMDLFVFYFYSSVRSSIVVGRPDSIFCIIKGGCVTGPYETICKIYQSCQDLLLVSQV